MPMADANDDDVTIATTRITTNNSASVPSAFRNSEDVGPGDDIEWIVRDGEWIVRAQPADESEQE